MSGGVHNNSNSYALDSFPGSIDRFRNKTKNTSIQRSSDISSEVSSEASSKVSNSSDISRTSSISSQTKKLEPEKQKIVNSIANQAWDYVTNSSLLKVCKNIIARKITEKPLTSKTLHSNTPINSATPREIRPREEVQNDVKKALEEFQKTYSLIKIAFTPPASNGWEKLDAAFANRSYDSIDVSSARSLSGQLDLSPGDLEDLRNIAIHCYNQGYPESYQMLKVLVLLEPNNAVAWNNFGFAARSFNQQADAELVKRSREVLLENKSPNPVHERLALALVQECGARNLKDIPEDQKHLLEALLITNSVGKTSSNETILKNLYKKMQQETQQPSVFLKEFAYPEKPKTETGELPLTKANLAKLSIGNSNIKPSKGVEEKEEPVLLKGEKGIEMQELKRSFSSSVEEEEEETNSEVSEVDEEARVLEEAKVQDETASKTSQTSSASSTSSKSASSTASKSSQSTSILGYMQKGVNIVKSVGGKVKGEATSRLSAQTFKDCLGLAEGFKSDLEISSIVTKIYEHLPALSTAEWNSIKIDKTGQTLQTLLQEKGMGLIESKKMKDKTYALEIFTLLNKIKPHDDKVNLYYMRALVSCEGSVKALALAEQTVGKQATISSQSSLIQKEAHNKGLSLEALAKSVEAGKAPEVVPRGDNPPPESGTPQAGVGKKDVGKKVHSEVEENKKENLTTATNAKSDSVIKNKLTSAQDDIALTQKGQSEKNIRKHSQDDSGIGMRTKRDQDRTSSPGMDRSGQVNSPQVKEKETTASLPETESQADPKDSENRLVAEKDRVSSNSQNVVPSSEDQFKSSIDLDLDFEGLASEFDSLEGEEPGKPEVSLDQENEIKNAKESKLNLEVDRTEVKEPEPSVGAVKAITGEQGDALMNPDKITSGQIAKISNKTPNPVNDSSPNAQPGNKSKSSNLETITKKEIQEEDDAAIAKNIIEQQFPGQNQIEMENITNKIAGGVSTSLIEPQSLSTEQSDGVIDNSKTKTANSPVQPSGVNPEKSLNKKSDLNKSPKSVTTRPETTKRLRAKDRETKFRQVLIDVNGSNLSAQKKLDKINAIIQKYGDLGDPELQDFVNKQRKQVSGKEESASNPSVQSKVENENVSLKTTNSSSVVSENTAPHSDVKRTSGKLTQAGQRNKAKVDAKNKERFAAINSSTTQKESVEAKLVREAQEKLTAEKLEKEKRSSSTGGNTGSKGSKKK